MGLGLPGACAIRTPAPDPLGYASPERRRRSRKPNGIRLARAGSSYCGASGCQRRFARSQPALAAALRPDDQGSTAATRRDTDRAPRSAAVTTPRAVRGADRPGQGPMGDGGRRRRRSRPRADLSAHGSNNACAARHRPVGTRAAPLPRSAARSPGRIVPGHPDARSAALRSSRRSTRLRRRSSPRTQPRAARRSSGRRSCAT